MSYYRFGRFGTLIKVGSPLGVYLGEHRLTRGDDIAWWWPINWIVLPPIFAFAFCLTCWQYLKKGRSHD